MYLAIYDEFGIYTTEEEIENYVKELVSEGETDLDVISNKCVVRFGEYCNSMIEYIVYGN